MREIVHLQAGQCGNQIGAKVSNTFVFKKKYIYIYIEKAATSVAHVKRIL